MRGKAIVFVDEYLAIRITPACAGKSPFLQQDKTPNWDHPRMCGEKHCLVLLPLAPMGSPPHVRGKAGACNRSRSLCRITPACAGKRHRTLSKLSGLEDHPRVCGEKKSGSAATACSSGSPPHVRGKENHAWRKRQAHGITPACAGKSPFLQQDKTPNWDHPRMCGEK